MGKIGDRMRNEYAICREQYVLWGHIAAKTVALLLALNAVPLFLLCYSVS